MHPVSPKIKKQGHLKFVGQWALQKLSGFYSDKKEAVLLVCSAQAGDVCRNNGHNQTPLEIPWLQHCKPKQNKVKLQYCVSQKSKGFGNLITMSITLHFFLFPVPMFLSWCNYIKGKRILRCERS